MLEGLMAPLRVVLRRSLADWLIVVAVWLVIACATTLLSVGVLYGDAVALTGLRQVLDDQPVAAKSIEVQMRVDPEELAAADEAVTSQSRRILGWTGGQLIQVLSSGSFTLPEQGTDDEATAITVFAAHGGIREHARLTDGAWPQAGADPIEAAVSVRAASELGVGPGDELQVTRRAGADEIVTVRVTGTWEPIDPTEAYWRGEPLELEGVEAGGSFTTIGPLVVEREDLLGRLAAGDLDVAWRTLPEFENLALEDVRWMRSDTAALERRIGQELGGRAFFSVNTGLPDILEGVERSLLVSRSGVLVLTIQFAILAAYALVLVAGLLVEQRRIETALLRSRGASAGHVAWMALLEGLLLVVPAALAAPWLALAALEIGNAVGPLAEAGVAIEPRITTVTLAVAGGAGIACLLGLVAPAFASGRGLAAVRQTLARQGNRTLAQRLGIDLALVVLAGIGLWQLRQYGAPLTRTVRGTFGLDPLLVAAPAIGLIAGAILALRIVPLLAQLAERALERRPGLVAPLGARQLARRPLRYTRAALLLMLAAALGTFAASYTTTWTQSQDDQASHQAAADLRVDVASFPDLPLWAFGGSYEAVDGVETAIPVVREALDLAGETTSAELLAIDAGRAAEVVNLRSDLAPSGTDELMAAIEPDLGTITPVPIPGEPSAVVITVESAFESAPVVDAQGNPALDTPVPDSLLSINASVVVRDARGMVHAFPARPQLRAAASGQEATVELFEVLDTGERVTPAYPLELLSVELALGFPENSRVLGEVEITGLDSVDADGASTPIELVPGDDGWSWLRQTLLAAPAPADTVEGDRGRVLFEENAAIFGDDGPTTVRLVPEGFDAFGDTRLPVLVSSSFADETHSRVGDMLALGSLTRRTAVEVAGIVDAFPTIGADESFVVIDVGAYALASYVRNGSTLFADEWWLTVTDEDAAIATLQRDPYSTEQIISRDERHRELLADPVALGVMGALGIGSIAALIVAAIGFVVSGVVSTRERLGEFALLRAMGLSPRQLAAWLSLENAFLLLVGVLVGCALGLVLAWLVLPFVTLTQEATVVVPPVRVEIPWTAIASIVGVALLALVLTVLVVSAALRRVRVSGVLRAGED